MMTIDPIVEEVRANREAFAARFNYDLDAIFAYLKEQEKTSGRVYVDLSRKADAPLLEGCSATAMLSEPKIEDCNILHQS